MGSSYKDSGVDINAGEETVNKIKDLVKSTHSKSVLTGIGHFGAFFEPDFTGYKNPVLVSSVDGVGTKLKIAVEAGIHNTVGQDLVNHCVNDIAVCGAEPLYFMDYLAFGKLDPAIAASIIEGFTIACKENNTALVGGETAEMPGMYQQEDYDMSGTIVGVVDKDKIINGEKVEKGNVLIGFESNGLHTNGYSLVRKVLFPKYKLEDNPEPLETTIGKELLKVHRPYLALIKTLKEKYEIKAFSHITGGGIVGNTKRVVPDHLKIEIDWNAWEPQPIFKLIQETGEIPDEEMRHVFNLGIGLITIADKKDAEKILENSKDYNPVLLGEIK